MMEGTVPTAEPLWSPTPEQSALTNLARFGDWLATSRGLTFDSYNDLWTWSVTDLEGFWSAIWEFFGLDDYFGPSQVLADDAMPGAQWFVGSKVNFADFLLRQGQPGETAFVTVGEAATATVMTWEQLRADVAALAATLRGLGVDVGDRVVGYLPNIAETAVAFLATASLGAVWSSVGQDYAAAAAVDRFAQLEPKVLIAADGYRFAGKDRNRLVAVAELRTGLPSLTATIMVSRLGVPGIPADALSWAQAIAESALYAPVQVPFDHPLWVLFSSGTTGLPKGLVHGHGGVLVEQLKLMSLHMDLTGDDRFFWFTSPSWVMWNLMIGTMTTGASVVCYDGSPSHPDPRALWRIVADLDVTLFGTSPGFLQASESAGVRPAAEFDLSKLRALSTSGSPLSPASNTWATRVVGPIPLYSISGGTDIVTAFCGGAPTVPIWPGELSVRCLGVAMQAWDPSGDEIHDQVGELVVTRPMPSMPVGFWNDPDGSRYHDAYFSTYPGVWRHGDWVTITGRGTVIIHGRSDATLNRNGIRMGTSDIYAAVEAIPEVADALVIGADQRDGTYWMPLFVALRGDGVLSPELIGQINSTIRDNVSPRHVPDEVIQVPGIPHTRTGKRLEVPIKRIMQGAHIHDVINIDVVDNAALLDAFVTIAHGRKSTAENP
jgi:acetoacetyl-CoA synthetase